MSDLQATLAIADALGIPPDDARVEQLVASYPPSLTEWGVELDATTARALAVLSWMVAMTKLELSKAYPFASISFVLILVLSGLFLNESVNGYKIAGVALIVCGVIVSSQG